MSGTWTVLVDFPIALSAGLVTPCSPSWCGVYSCDGHQIVASRLSLLCLSQVLRFHHKAGSVIQSFWDLHETPQRSSILGLDVEGIQVPI